MTADLQAIRNATDLRQLALDAGIKLNRNGRGKCPFCASPGTRNFSLGGKSGGHQFFTHCCRIGGDAFTLVQRLDSCDLPTAVRRLAADAGITLDNKPETPQERHRRERDKLDREMCSWWMRERWKEARRGLNRAMRAWEAGNPFAEDLAGIYGGRLRWIEQERTTAAGMAEFRARPRVAGERKQCEDWVIRSRQEPGPDIRIMIADDCIEKNFNHAKENGWKDPDSFAAMYGPEALRHAYREAVVILWPGSMILSLDSDKSGVDASKKYVRELMKQGLPFSIPDFAGAAI